MEGYHIDDIAKAREAKKYPTNNSHICLIAQDQQGLSNLWAWSTIAYDRDHFYYRPLADPALMRQYSAGLYGSDGCLLSGLGRAVEADDIDAARLYLGGLQEIFQDRFYVELQTWQFLEPHPDEAHPHGSRCLGVAPVGKTKCQTCLNILMTNINKVKVELANKMGIRIVVVNDCHHAFPADWQKKDRINKIGKDKGDQLAEGQKADHLMGDDELYHYMSLHGIGRSTVEEAIRNAHDIAASCTAEIKPMLDMPSLTQSEHEDMVAFIDAVEQGFRSKVIGSGLDEETYFRRMEAEVQTICERRFAGYFLTVADYVGAAKTGSWSQYVKAGAAKDPMTIGPGRGSAGGSLVSWLMGITALDPIRYDLIFERFLAPGRKGYPDIDVDFPQSKLRGMIEYLQARHGHEHVCGIGTVGRSGAKGMLRDLARTMPEVTYRDLDAMSKLIEQATTIVASAREGTDDEVDELGWKEILTEKGGDLIPWARKYPDLFEQLGELVGVARQSGKHASGVLINNKPLLGLIPLRTRNHNKSDETVTTQWDMWDVEEMGGVKFDLLGLRHLDTLDGAAKLVTERHGVPLDFETFDAQMGDPAIWSQVDRGHTTGLFQVETPGSTRTAIDLKPRNELDVAALVSIVRPGVKDAGETDRFLKRRAGLEPVVYEHPMIEAITSETYGIFVYQEQMIRAARDLAGFTPAEADELRKVTAKKLADQIAPFEAKFRDGCLANPAFMDPLGGDRKKGERIVAKIWASINASARYSFNKSHAVGYSLISCWEAWLAHHYTPEYLVSLMATDTANINRYVREARRRGIPILPPDINESKTTFTIGAEGIRYGLNVVRSVGAAATKAIAAHRPFVSPQDFFERSGVNRTVAVNLIKIGALDSLEYTPARDGDWRPACRSRLLQQFYDHTVWMGVAEGKRAKMDAAQRAELLGQWYLKHSADVDFDKDFHIPDFSDPDVVYAIEQELVGTHVLVDPMEPYLAALDAVSAKSPADVEDHAVGDVFVIGGQITKVKPITTKGGKKMGFIAVMFNEQEFDITVFSEAWASTRSLLKEGAPVACTVIRDERGCHLSGLERLDILWRSAS